MLCVYVHKELSIPPLVCVRARVIVCSFMEWSGDK